MHKIQLKDEVGSNVIFFNNTQPVKGPRVWEKDSGITFNIYGAQMMKTHPTIFTNTEYITNSAICSLTRLLDGNNFEIIYRLSITESIREIKS